MSKFAFSVLHAVEEAATGTVNGSVNVFGTTFNTKLTGSLDNSQPDSAEKIGKDKAGAVLLKAAEAVESAFFAGIGTCILSVPAVAPSDTNEAQYYNLAIEVTRL